MQNFSSAEIKTASTPEAQKLYSDAVKNFKKLHGPKLKLHQKIKARFHWIFAIGAIYLVWNSNNPQLTISVLFLGLFTLDLFHKSFFTQLQVINSSD